MSTFKYCPLIWMFCGKTENKSIYKIHSLRLIYDTEDATFKDLLKRGKSRTIHEDNMHTLLVEIYKSIHYISPPIMWNFFNLQRKRYNLRGSYLLKLPDTSTSRYDTQALCFKESLLWNKIPNKYKIYIL